VAGTWDGVVMRGFINGVVQPDVAAITGPLSVFPGPLRVGRGSGPLLGFKGDLDELTLYSRALSAAEIKAIYAAGSAGKCK
jgi:hypothetical protein